MMNHLVLYCRPGFESDLAAEISDSASMMGFPGYPKTEKGSGYVLYCTHDANGAQKIIEKMPFRELTFARQWFASPGLIEGLPKHDRVGPLMEAIADFPQAGEVVIETVDTNDAESLTGFCRKLTSPCSSAMRQAGLLSPKRNRKQPRLHLFFVSSDAVYPGISHPTNSSPEEMGIIRLKLPADAPSRSTLKLEEAWKWFLSIKDTKRLLEPGMTAVDLGAAPGGWTYQLAKQHFRIAAVDNGPMQAKLMDTGQVKHIQMDGFKYQPEKTVDWLVCDMIEQPSRVALLMATWVVNGWCRQAIFNLKLPMKRRYQAVCEARDLIDECFADTEMAYQLSIKHLYHDREEVTCFLRFNQR